ncbi:transglutaminase-like cysteine peptidase [Pseudaminobacter salicylatoxidans]|uniref:transglutaminase-like cysteine peptidase n=1 Tax=Pseudaminobacter salicylatoxidans TaxID=93369 RepID=UPI0004750A33|nr:transglutaminase-like cysteine peptidase [Pseudaminobacter salicylatoxidans]
MTRTKAIIVALAALMGLGGAMAQANAAEPFMHVGSRTTQPVGHYEFCRRLPDECNQKTPRRKPIELTRKLWAAMIDVNAAVNTEVAPRTDMEIYGQEEYWAYPDNNEGDCEDYVLEKRRRLMALGVPAGDLLITVVRQPNGDGHAVLTVRTGSGEFILDNLEPQVLAWGKTDYTYLKRQSEHNSGVWIQINDGRADAVASLR